MTLNESNETEIMMTEMVSETIDRTMEAEPPKVFLIPVHYFVPQLSTGTKIRRTVGTWRRLKTST